MKARTTTRRGLALLLSLALIVGLFAGVAVGVYADVDGHDHDHDHEDEAPVEDVLDDEEGEDGEEGDEPDEDGALPGSEEDDEEDKENNENSENSEDNENNDENNDNDNEDNDNDEENNEDGDEDGEDEENIQSVLGEFSALGGEMSLLGDNVTGTLTEATEITAGKQYVILNSDKTAALSNEQNTGGSGYYKGVSVTVADGKLTVDGNSKDSIVWEGGEGGTLKIGNSYLGVTGTTSSSLTYGSTASQWSRTGSENKSADGSLQVASSSKSRSLYYNSSAAYNFSMASHTGSGCTTYLYSISFCTHSSGSTKVDAKAATCTEAGNKEYYECNDCKAAFEDAAMTTATDPTIPATGHTLVYQSEDANNTYYKCSVCEQTVTVAKDPRLAQMTLTGVTVTFEDGTYPWIVNPLTDANKDTVTNGLISQNQGKSSSSSITTITFTASKAFTLSFDYACQGERTYDYIKVTVDGTDYTAQGASDGVFITKSYSQSLDSGDHTVVLNYIKDSSGDKGADTGYIYNIVAEVDCEHTNLTHHAAVPHTCTTDGTVEYWECNECHKTFSDEAHTTAITDTVDKAAHTYNDGVVTLAANCSEAGTMLYTCTVCDENTEGHTKTVEISATGEHNFVDGYCTNTLHDGSTCNKKKAWDGTTKTEPSQDDGVYQIGSGEELAWFANAVNTSNSTYAFAKAVLTDDIDLGGDDGDDGVLWTPIGKDSSNYFKGTFDGQGHTVGGVKVATSGSDASYGGLFGGIYGTTSAKASVSNVNVSGSVSVTSSGKAVYVGGVVGYSYLGEVEDCASDMTVYGKTSYGYGSAYVGGVVGYPYYSSVVEGCTYTGSSVYGETTVTGTSYYAYVGGVAGYLGAGSSSYTSYMRNCSAVAPTGGMTITSAHGNTSTSSKAAYSGGLAGYINYGYVLNNYCQGATLEGARTGGLVGGMGYSSYVRNNFFNGTVNGSYYKGGLVGYGSSSGYVQNNYAAAAVMTTVGSDKYVDTGSSLTVNNNATVATDGTLTWQSSSSKLYPGTTTSSDTDVPSSAKLADALNAWVEASTGVDYSTWMAKSSAKDAPYFGKGATLTVSTGVAGASVTVTGPDSYEDSAETDSSGDAKFPMLDAGTYTVSVSATGYNVDESSKTATIGDDLADASVSFTLTANHTHAYTKGDDNAPEWVWAEVKDDDGNVTGYTAKATFKCDGCSYTWTVDAAEVTHATTTPEDCGNDGVETYTATVNFTTSEGEAVTTGTDEANQYTGTKEVARPATGLHTWVDNNGTVKCSVCKTELKYEKFDDFFEIIKPDVTASSSNSWTIADVSGSKALKNTSSTYTITLTANKAGTLSFDYYIYRYSTGTYYDDYTYILPSSGSRLNGSTSPSWTTASYHLDKDGTLTLTVKGNSTSYYAALKNFTFEMDCDHTNIEHHAVKEHTCTVDGNIEYWYCPTCGKYFSDSGYTTQITQAETVIPAAHTPPTGDDAYTANYNGTHSYKCTVCENTIPEDCDWENSADGTYAMCSKCGATAVKNPWKVTDTKYKTYNVTPGNDTKLIILDTDSMTHAMSGEAYNTSYLKAVAVSVDADGTLTVTDGSDPEYLIWTWNDGYLTNEKTGNKLTISSSYTSAGSTTGTALTVQSYGIGSSGSYQYFPSYSSGGYFLGKYGTNQGYNFPYKVTAPSSAYTPVPDGHTHEYTASWAWADDYSSATLTLKCSLGDSTVTREAEVEAAANTATCTEAGTGTFTATVTYEGVTYTDTKANVDVPARGHTTTDGTCERCNKVIAVGEYGSKGTSGYSYAPYYNYYQYVTTQSLYTSKQVGATGTLDAIAFNVATASEVESEFVRVYLGTTELTALSTSNYLKGLKSEGGDLTLVYEGSPTLGAKTGWEKLVFNKATFDYDGESNLVVVIARHLTSTNTTLKYYQTASTSGSVLYRYNASNADRTDITSSGSSYSGTDTKLPDAQFEFATCNHQVKEGTLQSNDNGTHSYTCSVCGETVTVKCTSDEHYADIAATADHNGQHTSTCTVCKGTITEDCDYTSGETVEIGGTTYYTCVCGNYASGSAKYIAASTFSTTLSDGDLVMVVDAATDPTYAMTGDASTADSNYLAGVAISIDSDTREVSITGGGDVRKLVWKFKGTAGSSYSCTAQNEYSGGYLSIAAGKITTTENSSNIRFTTTSAPYNFIAPSGYQYVAGYNANGYFETNSYDSGARVYKLTGGTNYTYAGNLDSVSHTVKITVSGLADGGTATLYFDGDETGESVSNGTVTKTVYAAGDYTYTIKATGYLTLSGTVTVADGDSEKTVDAAMTAHEHEYGEPEWSWTAKAGGYKGTAQTTLSAGEYLFVYTNDGTSYAMSKTPDSAYPTMYLTVKEVKFDADGKVTSPADINDLIWTVVESNEKVQIKNADGKYLSASGFAYTQKDSTDTTWSLDDNILKASTGSWMSYSINQGKVMATTNANTTMVSTVTIYKLSEVAGEGYASATATFTCTDTNCTKETDDGDRVKTVTDDELDVSNGVYTATVTFNNKTYTATQGEAPADDFVDPTDDSVKNSVAISAGSADLGIKVKLETDADSATLTIQPGANTPTLYVLTGDAANGYTRVAKAAGAYSYTAEDADATFTIVVAGDADDSGDVDVADLQLLQAVLTKQTGATITSTGKAAAHVSGTGSDPNFLDVLSILRHILSNTATSSASFAW